MPALSASLLHSFISLLSHSYIFTLPATAWCIHLIGMPFFTAVAYTSCPICYSCQACCTPFIRFNFTQSQGPSPFPQMCCPSYVTSQDFYCWISLFMQCHTGYFILPYFQFRYLILIPRHHIHRIFNTRDRYSSTSISALNFTVFSYMLHVLIGQTIDSWGCASIFCLSQSHHTIGKIS